MATIDSYVVDIKVRGDQDLSKAAVASDDLGKSLKGLNEHFESAKTKAEAFAVAVAGIGLTEYIHSTLEAASKTKDLSEAYGLTIETILELEAGFRRAGRGADDMSKMMTTLAIKANESADGNLKVSNAFNDLGIKFTDLKNMSMDQIFVKIAKTMEDSHGDTQKLAAAMEVLGKGAKGIPWGDFVEGITKADGKMGEAAAATEKLDATMKQLEASSANIRREFMILLGPIADVFNKFMEGSDNAKLAAEGLAAAMVIIGGALTVKGITALAEAFAGFAAMLGLSTTATASESAALAANTAATVANSSAKAAGLAAKVASIEASIAEANATLAGEATTMTEAAAKAVLERNTWRLVVAKGAAAEASAAEALAVGATSVALQTEAVAATEAAAATTAFGTAVSFVMTKLGPIAIALSAIATAYQLWEMYSDKNKAAENVEKATEATKENNKENDSVIDKQRKQLDLQASAAAALRLQYDAQALLLSQSQKRLDLQLSLVGAGELEKTAALANYDQQAKKQQEILKLQQDIEKIKIQAANDPDGPGKYASQLAIMENQLKIIVQQKDRTAELTVEIKKAEQAQLIRKFQLDAENKSIEDQIRIQTEIANLTKTSDQQRIASLQERIQLEARAEIVRREALLGNGQKLGEEEQLKIIKQLTEAYKPLIDQTNQLIDKSRDFNTGWEKAFNQYADDATNAAKRAGDLFNAVTSNMNSAIDNFVDNGKLSFSDLATSMIKDMLKIELKASMMNLMNIGKQSGFSFSSMLGFADGGDPPVGVPSIVGENGPEVFIPKTAGTVVPNSQLGGMGGTTNHNTYVTNSISAIDAKGVAQLFAENRMTLLGSVKMAEKELPYKLA